MSQAPGAIVAEISAREVSGQIAVGSHNLQVVADHGAIVNLSVPPLAPVVRARPTPVAIKPRDFPDLLGREHELALTRSALADGVQVAFHGPPGTGKTSLLRRLAHLGAGTCEHGIVFVRAAGQPVADLEQFLFEAFYETDAPCQPSPAELRLRLADRRALVVVDDLEHGRDDVAQLLDCAPSCRFLLASTQACLWGEGRAQELDGLDAGAALALLARALGRDLSAEEQTRAAELCRLLDGQPLRLLQAAALARDGELALDTPDMLEQRLRAGLEDSERRVLRALELLAPAAVHVDDVAAIAGVPDAATVLERLQAAGAAQAHGPRYSATLSVAPSAPSSPEDEALLARARARLAASAARRPVEDVPVLLATLHADVAAQRWSDVLALVRAADPQLTLSARWGAWEVALELAHTAARASGDRAASAWALHQLGTRSGCLGDVEIGSRQLKEALALRRALGDETGAAVSAHNLAVLRGGLLPGGGPQDDGPRNDRPRGPSLARALAIGAVGLAAGAGAALLLAPQHDSATLTPVNAAVSQPASGTQSPGTTVTRTVTVSGTDSTVTQTVAVPGPTTTVTQTITQIVTVAPPPTPPPVIR